jgi:hypothetical protein
MKDSNFLRHQADLCIALSRSTFDLTLAGRLRAMADEFRIKASEWDSERAANGPPRTYGQSDPQPIGP